MVLSPAALLVTVALLWYYSSRSVGWASILVTGYTWFCALSVLALRAMTAGHGPPPGQHLPRATRC